MPSSRLRISNFEFRAVATANKKAVKTAKPAKKAVKTATKKAVEKKANVGKVWMVMLKTAIQLGISTGSSLPEIMHEVSVCMQC